MLPRRRTVAGIDQADLADPDNSFYDIDGVTVHHKVCEEGASGDQSKSGLPIVLLHGFGASVFSWSRVMRPLARITGAKVLAFDRPAFGLTSRTSCSGDDTNPYSVPFSAMATLAFIDYLGAKKAVLVGHSAGCLVAADAYFEAPEQVAALVLVAPAILVPASGRKGVSEDVIREQGKEKDDSDDNKASPNSLARIWRGFLEMSMCLVLKMVTGVQDVRFIMDKFGIMGVRYAWYDASKVTDHVIQGYTKPLRSRGWEKALLEHTIAMITDYTSKSTMPVSKRLSEISCPVLVATGDTDRLVPASNSECLARAIPGATFEVIKNCGHLPHEERAEEFLSLVEQFLQKVLVISNEQVQVFHAAV